MAKRRRKKMPLMLWWDLREQSRFIASVERFESLVNDLSILVAKKKRRSAAAAAANLTRKLTTPIVTENEKDGEA